tara:strand:- start:186 stop:602 length:417 start_codon:yes stop_codon:yes gene_type:complete
MTFFPFPTRLYVKLFYDITEVGLLQSLIIERSDNSNYGKWEFLGGKMMMNESITESIEREIYEELSIKVKGTKKLFESSIQINEKLYNLIFVHCKYISGQIDLKEHLNYKWINVKQLNVYDFLSGDLEFINQWNKDDI